MMIPLSRSGVSGIAIRNSNFLGVEMKPLFDVLKYNSDRLDVPNSNTIPSSGGMPSQSMSPPTNYPPIIQLVLMEVFAPLNLQFLTANTMAVVTSEGIIHTGNEVVTSPTATLERRGDTSLTFAQENLVIHLRYHRLHLRQKNSWRRTRCKYTANNAR